ncbi:MAG: class IV adenylate cyclase [Deltaproteobacteria bacterium]|nr:class IV adenylate cyclase [Deltaproteobacteria bacterium]
MAIETEIKLALESKGLSTEDVTRRLIDLGFIEISPGTFEDNLIFDSVKGSLARQGKLLRLRRYGDKVSMTFKKPGKGGKDYKVREEVETEVLDMDSSRMILQGIGLSVVYRYQKYRAEFRKAGLLACLDNTPIGDFLELEGEPRDIDRYALKLGFRKTDYVTVSYRQLHKQWAEETGKKWPRDMVFEKDGHD